MTPCERPSSLHRVRKPPARWKVTFVDGHVERLCDRCLVAVRSRWDTADSVVDAKPLDVA